MAFRSSELYHHVQGIVKATVFGVFDNLKFKISEAWTKIEVVLTALLAISV